MFKINWFPDRHLAPGLSALCPPSDQCMEWNVVDRMFFAEKDGFFNFYYFNPIKPCGHKTLILPCSIGEFIIKGPWCSRAGVINKMIDEGKIPGEHIVDCGDHAVRKSLAEKWLNDQGLFLVRANDTEPWYAPSTDDKRIVKNEDF